MCPNLLESMRQNWPIDLFQLILSIRMPSKQGPIHHKWWIAQWDSHLWSSASFIMSSENSNTTSAIYLPSISNIPYLPAGIIIIAEHSSPPDDLHMICPKTHWKTNICHQPNTPNQWILMVTCGRSGWSIRGCPTNKRAGNNLPHPPVSSKENHNNHWYGAGGDDIQDSRCEIECVIYKSSEWYNHTATMTVHLMSKAHCHSSQDRFRRKFKFSDKSINLSSNHH